MKKTQEKIADIIGKLKAWHSRFPDQIGDIVELEQEFNAKLRRFSSDQLRLSIGVMGQVKAGKSSFLNALLFEGKPILPEAATPKTANLTRIVHGEKPLLVVNYYSPDEWAQIEAAASSPGEHAEARVGRDLLKMVKYHGIDAQTILPQKETRIVVDDVQGLMNTLNDFVGENGRYTALVKSSEIHLPLEELKGLEIVDTPGMNDPVPSRTQKTREFMAECDVVFFLSRSSQFLDKSDMDLLAKQLPGKGVKRMALVACQFDGVLSDDGYDRTSLADTEQNVKTRISRRANDEIEKLAAFRDSANQQDVATLLRGLKTPIFASTFAHGYANWPEAEWGISMQHMHKVLCDMANSCWAGYQFTQEDWQRIGNFKALLTTYQQAKTDKEALLQAQIDGLMPETERELAIRLKALSEAVEVRAESLRTGDLKSLELGLSNCEARIQRIAYRLAEVIEKTRRQIEQSSREIRAELQGEISDAAKLQTRTGTKKETSSYTISTSEWYKPWTWGDEETISETTYVNYEYLATSDAIENLVNYRNESASRLELALNNIINISTLRNDLKRNLLDELNTNSDSFNPKEFRVVFEGTLSRLDLPEFKLNIDDISSRILNKFSGKVKDDKKMAALRETLREAIILVFNELNAALKDSTNTICRQLDYIKHDMAKKLTDGINKELINLQNAFKNKESELSECNLLLEICKGQKP